MYGQVAVNLGSIPYSDLSPASDVGSTHVSVRIYGLKREGG